MCGKNAIPVNCCSWFALFVPLLASTLICSLDPAYPRLWPEVARRRPTCPTCSTMQAKFPSSISSTMSEAAQPVLAQLGLQNRTFFVLLACRRLARPMALPFPFRFARYGTTHRWRANRRTEPEKKSSRTAVIDRQVIRTSLRRDPSSHLHCCGSVFEHRWAPPLFGTCSVRYRRLLRGSKRENATQDVPQLFFCHGKKNMCNPPKKQSSLT